MPNQTFKPLNGTAVANYIVHFLSQTPQTSPLTNLKLQKILFYLQAAFLVEFKQPLINDQFLRWQYGPVIEKTYFDFHQFGATPITKPVEIIDYTTYQSSIPMISKKFPYLSELNQYITTISAYSAIELVDLTKQQSIWDKYKAEIAARIAPNYTNEDIQSYFKNIESAQLWHEQPIEAITSK